MFFNEYDFIFTIHSVNFTLSILNQKGDSPKGWLPKMKATCWMNSLFTGFGRKKWFGQMGSGEKIQAYQIGKSFGWAHQLGVSTGLTCQLVRWCLLAILSRIDNRLIRMTNSVALFIWPHCSFQGFTKVALWCTVPFGHTIDEAIDSIQLSISMTSLYFTLGYRRMLNERNC